MKTLIRVALCSLLVALVPLAGEAQIPRLLSYQGVLTDTLGNPKSGVYTFTFRLYSVSSGGSALWTEIKDLMVTDGLFSTYLADVTPFGPGIAFDRPYWLGVKPGADPELLPRTRLASAAYSQNSLRSDTAAFALASNPDGDWQTSGSDIVRSTGNVGIGTASPSQKLDVVGTVRADRLTYSSPHTHYVSVPSEAFFPWNDVAYVNGSGNGGAYLPADATGALNATVCLPHGAIVTSVQWFVYDNSARDLSLNLYIQYLNSGGYNSVASASTSGTPGYSSVTASSLNHTVDNRTRGYEITAYANPWDGANLRIKGAVITYTLSEAP